MHRIMHRSHVGDNRVVFADRVAALPCTIPGLSINTSNAAPHNVHHIRSKYKLEIGRPVDSRCE